MAKTYRIKKDDFNKQAIYRINVYFVGNLTVSGTLADYQNYVANATIFTESEYIEIKPYDNCDMQELIKVFNNLDLIEE